MAALRKIYGGYRKVHSGGVVLRKMKPAITEASGSFSSSCSSFSFPTTRLQVRAALPGIPPARQIRCRHSGITTPGSNPPRRRCRWCRSVALFLNFAVAAAGFSSNKPEQTPACCAAASDYMVIQIIGDDYRLPNEPVVCLDGDLVSRFCRKCLPSSRLCLLTEYSPQNI